MPNCLKLLSFSVLLSTLISAPQAHADAPKPEKERALKVFFEALKGPLPQGQMVPGECSISSLNYSFDKKERVEFVLAKRFFMFTSAAYVSLVDEDGSCGCGEQCRCGDSCSCSESRESVSTLTVNEIQRRVLPTMQVTSLLDIRYSKRPNFKLLGDDVLHTMITQQDLHAVVNPADKTVHYISYKQIHPRNPIYSMDVECGQSPRE